MSTTRRVPGLVIPYTCESATVLEGAVLVGGAADFACKLPAAADPDPVSVSILGLAKDALSAAGVVDVVTSGIYPGIAGAAITKNQLLTVDDTSGRVKPAAPAPGANVGVIGWAQEDANDGERVAIFIAPGSFQG